jgi:hypothetical protein
VQTRPRLGLASFAAFVAISAFGGAVGLVSGSLDFGARLNDRLPFDSPGFAAVALAMIVGVPSTVVMVRAWHDDAGTAPAARVAGWLLIGWIAIEIAFIREFSFLQVVYGAAGIAYVVLARRRPLPPPPAMKLDTAATRYRRSGASSRCARPAPARPPAST